MTEKKPYPLGNRVLVEPIHETASSHIEMVEEQEPVKGTVLEVGPEVTTVKKGDEVVFKKYAAQEELDDFLIFREPDLLCVMR